MPAWWIFEDKRLETMSEKHEDKLEQTRWKRQNSNRWFALGICFLMLNAWAVLRKDDRPNVIDAVSHESVTEAEESPESIQIVGDRGEVVLVGKDEIRWDFPVDMVESSETHMWTFSGPVDFSPMQPGMFCWISQKSLIFKPEESWPIGRTVRTIRNDRLQSLDGDTFELRKTNYKTAPLKAEKPMFKGSGGILEFGFNTTIQPEELLKHLTIKGHTSKQYLKPQTSQTEPSRKIEVQLDDKQYQHLEITLSDQLLPADGDLGLQQTRTWTLRSTRELKVTRVRGILHPYGKGEITVSFSHKLTPSALRGNVEIQPDIPFQILPGNSYWQGQCRIVGDFEPGTSYQLTFREGIVSTKGWPNPTPIERSVRMSDRKADVSFLHAGSHLSPEGHLRLPVNSVNVDNLKVSISRIFPNNLVIFGMRNSSKYSGYYGYAHQGLSEPVIKEHSIPIQHTRNVPAETSIFLKELLEPLYTGIYHVDIKGDKSSQADRKVVHLTDIGVSLQHSDREILVWANSLSSLDPVADAKVTLFSENNQVLLTGTTNAEGMAHIPVPPNSDSKSFMLIVEKGKDAASLFLNETKIASPVAIVGRPYLEERHEAFLFTDRGIYRPGETVHLKAYVRDAKTTFAKPFPVELRVHHPDGRIADRQTAMLSKNGTVQFDVPFQQAWPLGQYTFRLALPGSNDPKSELGSRKVSLEEFAAAKLEVSVKILNVEPEKSALVPGEEVQFQVSAQHLTGRPAEDLPVRGFISYRPTEFSHPDWEEFRFNDEERAFPAELLQMRNVGEGKLNAEGQLTFTASTSKVYPPSNAELFLAANVRDVSGRAVAGSIQIQLQAYPVFVGLRQGDESGHFEAAVIHAKGQPAEEGTPIRFSVHQISHSLILRKDDNGQYRYQSDRHLTEVHEFNAHTIKGRATFALPDDLNPGNYLVRAQHIEGGSSASLKWEVLQGGTASKTWSSEEPEKVELSFHQETYQAGDTATLRIAAPFSGKALVTLQQDSILQSRILQLNSEGTGQVEFPVSVDHFPNAWATVSVIRKVVPNEANWQPHRAFGSAPLKINPEPRELKIQIIAPEQTLPSDSFSTELSVVDQEGNPVECELTLAMVDEGILSLTNFRTPDPLAYFHELRTPGFQLHHPYGLLLPDNDGSAIHNKLAVGAGGSALAKFLNPFQVERFKNFALWKSTIFTDTEGKASVDWEVPEFSGKVRLMAVAANAGNFGSAETNVIIKRPFTVVAGLPRFLAPEDQCQMPFRIFNDAKKDLDVTWEMKVSEHLAFEGKAERFLSGTETIAVGDSFAQTLDLSVGANRGIVWVELYATADEDSYKERINLSVRPAYAREYKVVSGVLLAGEEKTIQPGERFLASTTGGQLNLSQTPDAMLGPILESLVQYPYGCLEQTTSRTLPLLYVQDLFQRFHEHHPSGGEVAEYVQAGINQVLAMQHPAGTYGWWPSDHKTFHFGTLYATHFLLEAKAAGFPVADSALERSMESISGWLGKSIGPEAEDLQTYALQLLAMANKVPAGWLQRFWEIRKDLSVDSQINLALALLHSGDRRKANELATAIVVPGWKGKSKVRSWYTLRSPLRTQAKLLHLHVELDPNSAKTAKLVGDLITVLDGDHLWTTQENAMLLLALGKYAKHLGEKSLDTKALVVVDGETIESQDAQQTLTFSEGQTPFELQVKNEGPGQLYYSLTVNGIPETPPAPLVSGVEINRILDADDFLIQRGDLVTVELVVDTKGQPIDHLAIQDLLPAGLEIEASQPNKMLRHQERRDDRFLAFPTNINGIYRFEYVARAVTAGTFSLPAPTAVCMYDAEIQSIGDAGTLTIVEN